MQPRIIHCSFCLGEGHHIHRCKDSSISLLNEEIEEIAAIDWKADLNYSFLIHKLSELSLEELKVLGFKHEVPYVSKIATIDLKNMLTNIFALNLNRHRYIIENMNLDELDYYADKVYHYTMLNNHGDEITLNSVKQQLYRDHPAYMKYDITLYIESKQNAFEEQCPLCLENIPPELIVSTNCNHNFCCNCMLKHIRNNQNNKNEHVSCPLCRTVINNMNVFTQETYDQITAKNMFVSSEPDDVIYYSIPLSVSDVLNAKEMSEFNQYIQLKTISYGSIFGLFLLFYIWCAISNAMENVEL